MRLTRIKYCSHCKGQKVQCDQPENVKEQPRDEPIQPSLKPGSKRPAPRLPRREFKRQKQHHSDIFSRQEGFGRRPTVQLVSPIQSAVDRAKALIAFKRKCKGKTCDLEGAKIIRRGQRKVYNRNRNNVKILKKRNPSTKRRCTKSRRKRK